MVANLPYIESKRGLRFASKEVRAQPRSSLLSKRFGLGHIERLLERIESQAQAGGSLLEIGFDQADGRPSVFLRRQSLICSYERTIKDLAGFDRIAVIAAN